MIVIAALEAIGLVCVVALFLRHIAAIESQAASERSELASRIQHPEREPVDLSGWTFPELTDEVDEIGLVGTIADPPAEDEQ